ncbi:MAG TPA: DNA-directed RNA polymerase subunit omega [Candidatus Scybalocola faecigallinarum]|uniref:DNA-directed RNA polymerase subunit omega n=1 Tax=Candidatus Scybalocola faecigallinarum TaxID=2840941 RepID=A0A9D1F1Y1_9FIRM|nr:DNA-directed RNA polymerase subunit omega [Candidatus Scybalocola faecigallinarum]
MLHPSYTDLMAVVNSEVEEGEQPVVQSRYSIVIASAKRARQIIAGSQPLVDGRGKKPLSIAVEELYKGKVKVLGVDETDEDDEKILELSNEVFDVSLEDDEEDIFDDEKESSEDEEENAEGSDFEEDDE